MGCKNLKDITIPSTIISYRVPCFGKDYLNNDDYQIEKITINTNDVLSLENKNDEVSIEFYNMNRNQCELNVPIGLGKEYADKTVWSDFYIKENGVSFDKGAYYKSQVSNIMIVNSLSSNFTIPESGVIMDYDARTGRYSKTFVGVTSNFSFYFKSTGSTNYYWGLCKDYKYQNPGTASLVDINSNQANGISTDNNDKDLVDVTIDFWFEADGAHYNIESVVKKVSLGNADVIAINNINRVWSWDDEAYGCWGNRGCSNISAEDIFNGDDKWWGVDSEEGFAEQLSHTVSKTDEGDGHFDSYMVFDRQGNVTSYRGDGSVIRTAKYRVDKGEYPYQAPYKLNTKGENGGILWPFSINEGGRIPSDYDVVHIDSKQMMLVYNKGNGAGSWGESTYWRFKAVGEPMQLMVFGNDGTWDLSQPSDVLDKEGDIKTSALYSGDITVKDVDNGYGYFTLGTGICEADDWTTFNSMYRLSTFREYDAPRWF